MASFLPSIDAGVRALAYSKFGTLLSLTSMANDTALFPRKIAMRMIAETKGRTVASFISVWRERTSFSWQRNRTPVSRIGLNTLLADSSKTLITNIKAVPVDLEYSLWFISKSLPALQDVVDMYLFWAQTDPSLKLTFNSQYPLEYKLHFGDIVDESTVMEQFEQGLYYVYRMPLKVDGWIFDLDEAKTIKTIYLDVYDEEGTDNILLFERVITE